MKARQSLLTIRWSTTLSSKVYLPHADDFRAFFGANLVKVSSKFEGGNGSGIYSLQPPSGAEAQYKLDATSTNI